MAMEIDRLSNLPENILCYNILSHLPLTDVIRSSILSTSWRYLWTKVPQLDFSEEFFNSIPKLKKISPEFPRDPKKLLRARSKYINDTIDGILRLHSGTLESFRFYVCIFVRKGSIERWIRSATLKGVKQMALEVDFWDTHMDVPASLFGCYLLTDLELYHFNFTEIPSGIGGFLFLKTCRLYSLYNFPDDTLEQLIALCPLLQKLVIQGCNSLINLKIRAPNLNYLKLVDSGCSLTADCPQLAKLKVNYCFRLSKVQINSSMFLQYQHRSGVQSRRGLSTMKSVRKLFLEGPSSHLPFFALLGNSPDLEELKVAAYFIENMEVGQLVPMQDNASVSDLTIPNLKKAHIDISSEMSEREVAVLGFLLRNAPSLKTMTLILPYCPENIHDQQFINQVRDLQHTSVEMEIKILKKERTLDAVCMKIYSQEDDERLSEGSNHLF